MRRSTPKVAGPESVFLRRSLSIHNGMKARAAKLHIRVFPFSLADLRVWLLAKFTGGMAGTARCEYSGEMVLAENFSVDHRQPISRGGRFALDNLAICSEKQNLRKGNMSDREYEFFMTHITVFYPPEVQAAIWRKLEIGDVQRFSYFRRKAKGVTR